MALLAGPDILAAPVFIEAAAYPPLMGEELARLVVLGQTGGAWKEVPYQLDEIDGQRRIVMRDARYPDSKEAQSQKAKDAEPLARGPVPTRLGSMHRFAIDAADFAPCSGNACIQALKSALAPVCDGVPGEQPELHRFRLRRSGASAFIAICKRKAPAPAFPPQVEVDLKARLLSSSDIRYQFAERNHMLVDSIRLRGEGANWGEFLGASDFRLYMKPKFFFPLSFGGSDVRSELLRYQQNTLGASGDLSFYLSVLSLKIQLRLVSQVSVYRDSIHVPMSVTLPVSGKSLRAGSGVYYGFKLPGGRVKERIAGDMPFLASGPVPFAPKRVLALRGPGNDVVLGVQVPEAYRAAGLAPAIATPEELRKRGFPVDPELDFGVFFEVMGLQKSTYRMDLWFYLGKSGSVEELLARAQDAHSLETEPLSLAAPSAGPVR